MKLKFSILILVNLLFVSSCVLMDLTKDLELFETTPVLENEFIINGKIINNIDFFNNGDDIGYEGKITFNFVWPFYWPTIMYPHADISKGVWDGQILFQKDIRKKLSLKFWIAEDDENICKITKINGFNKSVGLKNLKLSGYKYVFKQKMPYTVFTFKINKNQYDLNLTKIKCIENYRGEGVSDLITTFLLPEQIYMITDSNNNVVAKFTESEYFLYQDLKDDNESIKEVIVFCLIAKEILKYN